MKKIINIIILLSVFTVTALLSSCGSDMSQQSKADPSVKVVIVTGGHDFDAKSFFQMFSSFENIDYVHLNQKDDSEIFEHASNLDSYDVIVLYNMSQKISEKRKKNFIDILSKGTGLVVLHHAVGAFDNWREYENIIGARYFHTEGLRDGVTYKKSTYKHDVDFTINIAQKQHPITRRIGRFDIHDETYKGCFFQKDNNILLTTNEPTSDNPICWTRQYGKSRVCYIQLGHGPDAYENENYRKLVSNAITWSAGELN